MKLIDELETEHTLIDQVVGAFRTFVAERLRGGGDADDGRRFMRFFRRYAGDFHHGREEMILFTALVEAAHLPASGPIATLLEDHHRMSRLLDGIEPLAALPRFDAASAGRLDVLARAYSAALWHHIDAENSVLLPESRPRLRRAAVGELPTRSMTEAERAAMEDGRALLERYAVMDDPSINRGDGCVCCPAFVDGCSGIEREWWNDWEWDEFEGHMGAD